ncbi:MAG: response regulator transcription factor [Betaproteobacteria bacterium]|nr:response regulator transcription factor [Betaproteobacteria bacterium]
MNEPLRILLVDDEAPARGRLREILADCSADAPNQVVCEAASGAQALALFPDCRAQLALVDIHMPGMSGIEFARHLQVLEKPPGVIFVTAHDQYAVQAFEVNAIDYLLKPVRAARLAVALAKFAGAGGPAREQLQRADPWPRRFFSSVERGRVHLIPVEEVLFLKAELKYVTVRTHEREFLIEDTLAQIEQESKGRFIRVHRNCLVAADRIRGAERLYSGQAEDEGAQDGGQWAVRLEGYAEPLAVSRRQWGVVKALVKR